MKLNVIDLFAGCGGLAEGFEQSGHYQTLAAVEWEASPRLTLANRFKTKWHMEDAYRKIMLFDMQRTDELFNGWDDDDKYGTGIGLTQAVGTCSVDVVIGGPPCQAYSLAGRIRDRNGMRDDYRNYLFESYLKVIERLQPKAFIFENVPGLLSARPGGELIAPKIIAAFSKIGYAIPSDLKRTICNMADFGLPQNRKRLIIVGLRKDIFGASTEKYLAYFYDNLLSRYRVKIKQTVWDAIGDLPALYPLSLELKKGGKKYSHRAVNSKFKDHVPRYHNPRDINIFKVLAQDVESKAFQYISTEKLKEIYTQQTGRVSSIHKYHVLQKDQPSNLIPAHLQKDGLRHIHPDPKQARSITVREAARLQGFPDDFEFIGASGEQYKMIGNAVPPLFSKVVALAINDLLSATDICEPVFFLEG